MARILKDEKKCSIQEGLFEYGREFQRLMVALWVILFLLFFLIITQHKQDMDYFLTLNEFYDRLEEVNGGLYSDIIGNVGENFQGTREKLELMDEKLKILQRLNVGNGFIRDMDDLGDMYDRYRSEVEKIYEFLGTENIDVEMVFEYYENTQSAFTFLNKDFQKMYSQILTFVKEKEEKQYVQKLFLLGVLVVVFSVLTRMKMKNTKLLVEKIAGPIKELAQEAKEVKTGDFLNQSLKTGESYFEEIDILQHVFASMLETLKKQMKEIIENANLKDQMRKKEVDNLRISNELKNSELKALQMQINPHFLFNTLNMIAKTAYMETAECTALLLECTASLLRYTLDNSMQPVPLEKELGMLKNYVSIQENRFGERIQFHFQLDKSLNQIQIPRLILQPVLENAITHGVGMKIVGAQIQIQTYRKDGCCVLTVFDNGQGMEQEDLEQVRKKMKEKCSGGEQVGLRNIYYRLRYFYGTEADLQIESKVEQGTKVTIIIPILPNQETEEANV